MLDEPIRNIVVIDILIVLISWQNWVSVLLRQRIGSWNWLGSICPVSN